jgi:hypothetical protein
MVSRGFRDTAAERQTASSPVSREFAIQGNLIPLRDNRDSEKAARRASIVGWIIGVLAFHPDPAHPETLSPI